MFVSMYKHIHEGNCSANIFVSVKTQMKTKHSIVLYFVRHHVMELISREFVLATVRNLSNI